MEMGTHIAFCKIYKGPKIRVNEMQPGIEIKAGEPLLSPPKKYWEIKNW
jgi:pyruvate kinase